MRIGRALAASLGLLASVAHAEPTKVQCIAADTRAQELRKEGKLHDALAQLDVCASAACPTLVRADCTERVDEIHRVLPSVVFDVKTASGADVADARVEMDGTVLRERLDGRPVSVDPGDHTFVLSARGSTQTLHVLVHEGDSARHVSMTVADPIAPPRFLPPSRTPRTIGLVVGSAGVVSLALGAVFGAIAIADHGSVTDICPNNVCPSTDAIYRASGANADSRGFATASTVAFIAGIVLAAVGVTLVLTSPRRPTLVVGAGTLSGTF